MLILKLSNLLMRLNFNPKLMEKFFWFKRNKKQVAFDEIDEMIATVDRNGDGRISYSEFRSKDLIFSGKKINY